MKNKMILVANQDALDFGECPFPVSVIPNQMGINLCSVESIQWVEQEDGQLVNLTINFIPEPAEITSF